jgi:Raf kinase inhibitor-like YbhB/YbcL family protein
MKVTSPSFDNDGFLTERFTHEGDGVNPALRIEEIPGNAKSLVLEMDDVDAPGGSFNHWIVFDIPVVSFIAEDSIPGKQGTSSAKRKNYAGPRPPSGVHRYNFRVYALDTVLGMPDGASKDDILKALQGHILDRAETVARAAATKTAVAV